MAGCDWDDNAQMFLDSNGYPCDQYTGQTYGGLYPNGSNYPGPVTYYPPNNNGGLPPNILVTPGGTQLPGSNLSNVLNNIGSWLALLTHQSAVPTALSQPGVRTNTNPINYPSNITPIGAGGLPLANGNLGGTVGSSLQKFISSPTGLLVIGAAVLLYMKPPGRR